MKSATSLKQNTKLGKKFVKNARNVLALPKDVFWPTLQENDNASLTESLKNVLRPARTTEPQIPWSEKRKLTKEERKQRNAEFYKNLPQDSLALHQKALSLKKDLALGVNEVCRGLEKNELACCLVAGDANPKLLVSHIADLSKTRRIPILIIDSLKKNTRDSLGFSALAIGFKNEIWNDSSHEMHGFTNEVINLFHKNYMYDVQTSAENELESDMVNTSKPNIGGCIDIQSEKHSLTPISEVNLDEIYLYRESTTCRVFRPNEISNSGGMQMSVDIEEDIGKTGITDNDQIFAKKGRYYDPPKILRVQSNPKKFRKHKLKK